MVRETAWRNILAVWLVGLVCLILFTAGIWDQGYIGFESRFALFAREMFANGPGWFPTTFGQPCPDYPSMSTWLIYLVACVLGGVNKFSTVFPTRRKITLIRLLGRFYDFPDRKIFLDGVDPISLVPTTCGNASASYCRQSRRQTVSWC